MTAPELSPALVGIFDQVADLLLPLEGTCTDAETRRAVSELRGSGPVGRAAAKHPEFVRRYAVWTRAEDEHVTPALERAIDELRGVRHALDEISAQVRTIATGGRRAIPR